MEIYDLGILGSDEAGEIYSDFFYSYDEGIDLLEIKKEIEEEWLLHSDSLLQRELCLAGFTKALWEVGELDETIVNELKEILEKEKTKDAWEELEKGLWKKRKRILERFLKQIKKPAKKTTPRNPFPKKENDFFALGDVIALEVENDFHVVLIVSGTSDFRNKPFYCCSVTDYYEKEIPTIDKVKEISEVYATIPEYSTRPRCFEFIFEHDFIKENKSIFKKVGQIKYSSTIFKGTSTGLGTWKEINTFLPFINWKEASRFNFLKLPLEEYFKPLEN